MLRERTLHHLLLAVARSLEEVPENSKYRETIRDSCETLKISREHRGPYLVSFSNEKGQVSKSVETSQFRFHERGDIPAQVKLREDLPDARSYNWEQATELWQSLLGVPLSRPRGLAPARPDNSKVYRTEVLYLVFISISLLSVEFYTGQIWPSCLLLAWTVPLTQPKRAHLWVAIFMMTASLWLSGREYPLFALIIVIISLHFEYLDKSRLAILWPFLGCLLIIGAFPDHLKIVMLVPIFEILVSLVQRSYRRITIQIISILLISSSVLIGNSNSLSINLRGWIILPVGLILSVVIFPYSSEPNLIRISSPLVLSLGAIYLQFDIVGTVGLLLVWALQTVLFCRVSNSTRGKVIGAGTPVSLRKRDLTS